MKPESDFAREGTAHRRRQLRSADAEAMERSDERIDYEGAPAHSYFRTLPFARLAELLRANGVDLGDGLSLMMGCGIGADLHYLRKFFAPEVVISDISPGCVSTTHRHFPDTAPLVADAENLPFDDGAFEHVTAFNMLHHLERPAKGIYEGLRVARKGFVFIEPHDCWLTRFATRVGAMQEIEPSGNYVYKFSRHDIDKAARAMFTRYAAASLFAPSFHSARGAKFAILKFATGTMNLMLPSQGNALVGYIAKPGEAG